MWCRVAPNARRSARRPRPHPPALTVLAHFDRVCPWCLIGGHHLRSVRRWTFGWTRPGSTCGQTRRGRARRTRSSTSRGSAARRLSPRTASGRLATRGGTALCLRPHSVPRLFPSRRRHRQPKCAAVPCKGSGVDSRLARQRARWRARALALCLTSPSPAGSRSAARKGRSGCSRRCSPLTRLPIGYQRRAQTTARDRRIAPASRTVSRRACAGAPSTSGHEYGGARGTARLQRPMRLRRFRQRESLPRHAVDTPGKNVAEQFGCHR